MSSVFLTAQQTTLATTQSDYPEWHLNRKKYALWYLQLEQQDCIDYCQQLSQHFSDFIIQPMQRQYHITIFVCGFLGQQQVYNDDFSHEQFIQQRKKIAQLNLSPIVLNTANVRSFRSSLFVEIEDSKQILQQLRQQMGLYAQEIRAQYYVPHLSLGIYNNSYSYAQIQAAIDALEQRSFVLTFKQLHFGYYQAQCLQGPLYAEHTLQLD
ncbi:2'-5' RNA ligase family protein [Acinetobacter rudis]|uniref:2'-5' RNA ligase family protein n=1 Tax=Acinetobacter rudis TaxID=632955 RepID=A0AAW8JD03_9GAMM|nr:2'-5' RNA ligase family protein [Acinetobacter rudis]MDQ8935559.1 2'-5' RNA ligase family protein [Acinetobacter rudis]MDQ8953319.1 2'-5' RNA ligase family protein [Acinetobacter rudis]MDQ9017822.1 2'-5' RNA ligase family protein [Acinetobacter rudis]